MSEAKKKDERKTRDITTCQISERQLTDVNSLLAAMTASVLQHLQMAPDESYKKDTDIALSKNKWIRMLSLNIFDASAMTYRAAAGKEFDKPTSTNISGQPCEGFFTGSMAEGVGCATQSDYSDTDIMNVLKNFKAVYQGEATQQHSEPIKNVPELGPRATKSGTDQADDSDSTSGTSTSMANRLSVINITDGSYPGYAKLLKSEATTSLLQICSSLNFGPVIRSSKEEHLLAHKFLFDNAFAVECEKWSPEASTWVSRDRASGWPSQELISKCAGVSMYIVSKSHALNSEDEFEWRYSFSRQEGILYRALPIEVRMVYIVSKLLIKQLKDHTLTTYLVKTMFLWHCEEKSEADFRAKELETNIEEFLDFMVQCLYRREVRNYFMPANNMISHLPHGVIEEVKLKFATILLNFFSICSTIRTAHAYPFSIGGIATAVEEGSGIEPILFLRIQSNFLHTVIHFILSSYLPFSHCMWMFTAYVPLLDTFVCTATSGIQQSIPELLQMTQRVQSISKVAFDVYGPAYIKLALLYTTLSETAWPKMSPILRKLPECFLDLTDTTCDSSSCIADVLDLLGRKCDSGKLKTCCHIVSEWVHRQKSATDIFMFTIKKFSTHRGHDFLLARLNEVAILLHVSASSVEIGIAVVLRLPSGHDALEKMETFCGIRSDISLDGALKQLVYVSFQFLENSDIPNEAESSLKASKALMQSNIYTSGIATFRFVSAICVFQKLNNADKTTVQRFLRLLQASEISQRMPDIMELETDIEDLLSASEIDLNKTFQFAVYYSRLCMVSTKLPFVLAVFDELLPPHFNLGVLSSAGLELTSCDLDIAINCLQTWIHRATEASYSIDQNKALSILVHRKLAHLYHIKSQSADEEGSIKRYRNKAKVMFQTAMKDDEQNLSVVADYLLLIRKTDRQEFNKYVQLAGVFNNVDDISSYFRPSIPAVEGLDELKQEIQTNGDLNVSSVALVHYLAIVHAGETYPPKEHVFHMQAKVGVLADMLQKLEESQPDCETERNVLSDTLRLLGYSAMRAKMPQEAKRAFSEAKSCSPDRCTCGTFIELFKTSSGSDEVAS